MILEIKRFFPLVTIVILALLSWFSYIEVANSVYWRIWHFDSKKISTAWIGLWKFCYLQYYPQKNHETLFCSEINSSWVYPTEFYYCQDLIILPIFLQVMGLIFSVGALLLTFKNEPYPHFINTCYLIAGYCFILSSISVGVSVTWNAYMDLRGRSSLKFPENFPINMAQIIKKEIGLSFPLGISGAASSFVSGILSFCQTCSKYSKISRVYPQDRSSGIPKRGCLDQRKKCQTKL